MNGIGLRPIRPHHRRAKALALVSRIGRLLRLVELDIYGINRTANDKRVGTIARRNLARACRDLSEVLQRPILQPKGKS